MSGSEFLAFVNASPSPFHAVANASATLRRLGFSPLSERAPWALTPGGSYYVTRNASALVAFTVGKRYVPGAGVTVVGAHTDSPCLKVKPKFHKNKSGPILRIPTLAIHLNRSVNDSFEFNNETQLMPLLASAAEEALNGKKEEVPLLLQLLTDELNGSSQLGIKPSDIGDFELCLFDTNPAVVGGGKGEYIFSARLDNLMMSYCALTSLTKSIADTASLENDPSIRMIALFDNEEVGSNTAHGADSNFLLATLERLAKLKAPGSPTAFEESLAKSYLISADMAHAIHPNYPEKHEDGHRPVLNKGVVVKQNANQRYATTSATTAILRHVADKCGVPLQAFVVRNDMPCGSTIGPMLSAKLGLRTIDVGNPQLSMHSIREQCGVQDIQYAVTLFEHFYKAFPQLDAKMHGE